MHTVNAPAKEFSDFVSVVYLTDRASRANVGGKIIEPIQEQPLRNRYGLLQDAELTPSSQDAHAPFSMSVSTSKHRR